MPRFLIPALAALLALSAGGCAAVIPIAIATEPVWGPAIENAVDGAVTAIEQKKP